MWFKQMETRILDSSSFTLEDYQQLCLLSFHMKNWYQNQAFWNPKSELYGLKSGKQFRFK